MTIENFVFAIALAPLIFVLVGLVYLLIKDLFGDADLFDEDD